MYFYFLNLGTIYITSARFVMYHVSKVITAIAVIIIITTIIIIPIPWSVPRTLYFETSMIQHYQKHNQLYSSKANLNLNSSHLFLYLSIWSLYFTQRLSSLFNTICGRSTSKVTLMNLPPRFMPLYDSLTLNVVGSMSCF